MNHPNTDRHETEKFDAMATRWWDLDGPCAPLHAINPIRFAFISRHVDLLNRDVLDIGCGGGILTERMAQAGARTTGIDMAEAALATARLHAKVSGLSIEYALTTAEDWQQNHNATYDVVTCMEMLEHVPDPASIIATCAALVKPGGWVFLSTINRNTKAYLHAIIGAEYVLRLLPKGTHDYLCFIKPSELRRCAEQHDLHVRSLRGMSYNPITRHYFETANLDVNYLVAFQRGGIN
jgi:2-polyprenyl-6-hydroxyphenyl methylase / 3-demethylubiquinone-9 3-methyltransferase